MLDCALNSPTESWHRCTLFVPTPGLCEHGQARYFKVGLFTFIPTYACCSLASHLLERSE